VLRAAPHRAPLRPGRDIRPSLSVPARRRRRQRPPPARVKAPSAPRKELPADGQRAYSSKASGGPRPRPPATDLRPPPDSPAMPPRAWAPPRGGCLGRDPGRRLSPLQGVGVPLRSPACPPAAAGPVRAPRAGGRHTGREECPCCSDARAWPSSWRPGCWPRGGATTAGFAATAGAAAAAAASVPRAARAPSAARPVALALLPVPAAAAPETGAAAVPPAAAGRRPARPPPRTPRPSAPEV